MNKPISRFPCGDMGLRAGGGRNPDPMPGFWEDSESSLSLDAIGPVRVTGRLGHGYALHTNRDPYPDPYDPDAAGISAGDGFTIEHNRGVEVVGVGDPDVDYFLPTGFVMRAYLSIDRLPVLGDVNYDGSYYPGGPIFTFFHQGVGITATGNVTLKANDGTNVVTEAVVGLDEYHLYEMYVEFRHSADDRTTCVALRVDEVVVAQICVVTSTYEDAGNLGIAFGSYSSGINVDDIAIDAITSGIGHWIGPGECAIIRPVSDGGRPIQSWASGTDYSPENGDPSSAVDPLHPQCTPGVLPNWYESLAHEVPYRPWNEAAEEGGIGGFGADFAIGYMMSNPGADPTAWPGGSFPRCSSARRAASAYEMFMHLGDPGFTPNFSRTFMYSCRSERHNLPDNTIGSEKLICGLAAMSGYAGYINFGLQNPGDTAWTFSTQYLDSDAAEDLLFVRRETNLPNVGINVFAAGSQVALDPTPGPALPVCTPVVDTARPIICFV